MQKFIDSHCHIHDKNFFDLKNSEELLARAEKNGITKMVCIGTDHEDSLAALDFVKKHKNHKLFWAYGVHPSEFKKPRELPDFKKNRPIAIGEVGLDYHYEKDSKEEQFKLFEEMIDLALKNDLPLIFHVREAFDDFFSIVDNFHGIRAVVHSFTDNKKNLKKALERDFYIGVNGMATYSTLPIPPLDRILLETDAPFLAPVPHRGETNEPTYIKDVATWLAEKQNVSLDEISKITNQNFKELFGI